jgi:acyl-coenzyme A synthetase/AMP-(fatty) acid ligase/3-hydroxymyristoyl/3-hydroxydecanoyl-(acyl carrier protein) dehydratase
MRDDGTILAPLERDPRTPFALGETPRAWAEFLTDAASVALALEASARRVGGRAGPVEWMVACADRYHCAVALLAVWSLGDVAALPPNGREETIDALCAEHVLAGVLHDGGGRGGVDIRGLLGTGAEPLALPRFAQDQPIVCVYTSGSTGLHLACPKTAGQLLGEAALLVRLFDLGTGSRLLSTVPPHHIYGLLFGVLVPFMGGGAFLRGTPHHAETIVGEARRWDANVLISVPAHLHGLTGVSLGALPGLRRLFSSGAALPAATAREVAALTGSPVTEVLGSSETGGIASRTGGDDRAWEPFPGVQVVPGADGVMMVKSPFSASTRGGDRIASRADGRFELLGRSDGIVKIGGSRISVAEIERLLTEVRGVREAAVITVDVPGPRQHELWAVVAAPALSVADLRAALLKRVEPISVPRRFRLVDALPREATGKLTKARLRALFDPSARLPEPQPPLATAVERPRDGAETAHVREVSMPADSPFFRGHFRDFPLLPGVVQVNELALREARRRWPDLRVLERVLALKFRSPIRPDDRVAIHLDRKSPDRVSFELRRDGKPLSSGVLVFES